MSDFDWPEPERSPISRALSPVPAPYGTAETEFVTRTRNGQDPGVHSVARHRAHEHSGGDPACPMCVFTVDGFQTQNCRSCQAPIVWATTEDRKSMPVDASTDPAGNVVLARVAGEVRVTVLDQDALFGDGVRRKSHFATCPDADSWRSRRSR
jgi:hypothetical protein